MPSGYQVNDLNVESESETHRVGLINLNYNPTINQTTVSGVKVSIYSYFSVHTCFQFRRCLLNILLGSDFENPLKYFKSSGFVKQLGLATTKELFEL